MIDRCVLLSLGDAVNGRTLPGRFLADAEWVLLVDGRLDEHDLASVVAHEVAHARLGHSTTDMLGEEEQERQARDLAAS